MLKRILHNWSTRKMRDECNAYVVRLASGNEEEMAQSLALAFTARKVLKQHVDYSEALLDSRSVLSEAEVIDCWKVLHAIHALIKNSKTMDGMVGVYFATGLEVWLHTFRCAMNPKLYVSGEDVWRQLTRGSDCLYKVCEARGKPILPDDVQYPARFTSRKS